MTGRLVPFPLRRFSTHEGTSAADRILSIPCEERSIESTKLRLEEPETLLALCEKIRALVETSPLRAKEEAEFLFRFLSDREQSVGVLDEHNYFLGEVALLAGIACRMLAQRENAARWFDRSESNFRLTVNAVADWSRVGYHRLALCLEERRFRDLFEQLPTLLHSFRSLRMADEAVKCRILEGLAQMETGEVTAASETFREALREARNIPNERLVGSCCVNLVHAYGMLGNAEEAMACSKEAMPILLRQNNTVALAQVQLGIGSLFREKNQFASAIKAYQGAMADFERIGMRADVAATKLMIADVLLEMEQEPLALKQLLEALPVIDEYRMVPEGMAALTLLRESLRLQKINRQALRDLHGYFEDLKS